MTFRKLLIANRGEIAIRIARAATAVGLPSVAIYSEDDRDALHPLRADEAAPLPGTGPRAYLDGDAILAVARAMGADAIHPGYGFLSENAAFARQCARAGVQFIGPAPRVLDLFGDKARARALALETGIPVVNGTRGATTLEDAQAFFTALPLSHGMMIKAVAGGGGRGMRAVHDAQAIAEAYARCVSEATTASGSAELYVEALVPRPRHIEIQIVADAHGNVAHLGERECSLQRRHQKLIEIAPSPALDDALRTRIADAAVTLANAAGYCGIGTFEFLVQDAGTPHASFYFMEANPRVQVEHTVTEMVTGVDLVVTQLALAQGASLADLGLAQPIKPRGHAIQVRINGETLDASGQPHPCTGMLTAFEPPNGPGVRVDTCGYAGYRPNPRFDSLLAKLIVHAPQGTYAQAVAQTYRALCEFRIEGLATNKRLLQDLLRDPNVQTNAVHTQFLDARLADLVAGDGQAHPTLHAASTAAVDLEPTGSVVDALAEDAELLTAPMDGALIEINAAAGATVARGDILAVIEAMKMEHVVTAPASGQVLQVCAQPGVTVHAGQPLVVLQLSNAQHDAAATDTEIDLDHIRPDLRAVIDRHAFGLDTHRPDAVARRRKTGQRTARENIDHLCDAGSFIEYGALAIAAQRQRRALDDLIRSTPADGIITGIGTVNAEHFADQDARCLVLAYDYTVLAGTQGTFNHKKTDRALELAQQWRLPVVLFAEGGGGRPGDTEKRGVSGLDCPTFIHFARLSGLVPTVGIVSGRCFAGNAALLGCADVIIATRDATIGMGGPAMIEGGGLGVYAPEEVGPVSMQAPNGVIDVLVEDEVEAVNAARRYLSYFQGPLARWSASNVRHLRHVIPENRMRSYDMRAVIEALADTGSVLELRQAFGIGIITALIRVEGRAFGCIANNPRHLGGAIDSAAADKASRFMQLCNAFDLPIVSLCDTPGFMVGPEAEKTATVRHVSRMFVTAGNLRVPFFTVVLRKGYGLGAMAMAAGGFHAPFFTASWPSGEFGGMGVEGAIRLGYRKELEAVEDLAEREALFRKMVDAAYEEGRALNIASYLEIDAVIDPADTRRWLLRGLQSAPPAPPRHARDPVTRRFIDTW